MGERQDVAWLSILLPDGSTQRIDETRQRIYLDDTLLKEPTFFEAMKQKVWAAMKEDELCGPSSKAQ